MIWAVLGFDRHDDSLTVEWELPAGFTVTDAARLVGDHPDLIGSSFPLDEAQAAVVAALMGTTADTAGTAYFLEAQSEG
ncbi:DUF7683 domain-containing protein [Kitasatospora sp. NPDC004289]